MFHYRIRGNFVYVESLCRGPKFLVVFIQIASVHSEFDIELCYYKLTKDNAVPPESLLLTPPHFMW